LGIPNINDSLSVPNAATGHQYSHTFLSRPKKATGYRSASYVRNLTRKSFPYFFVISADGASAKGQLTRDILHPPKIDTLTLATLDLCSRPKLHNAAKVAAFQITERANARTLPAFTITRSRGFLPRTVRTLNSSLSIHE